MCEYCGRDYEGIPVSLPLKNISGESVLKAYIKRTVEAYEITFELENGEYTLEISNCPMCQSTLALDKVYYVKTKEGYICEDMSKKTGILQTNTDKNYAFPESFKSLAECVAVDNNGEVIEEELFIDEINRLLSKFGY